MSCRSGRWDTNASLRASLFPAYTALGWHPSSGLGVIAAALGLFHGLPVGKPRLLQEPSSDKYDSPSTVVGQVKAFVLYF